MITLSETGPQVIGGNKKRRRGREEKCPSQKMSSKTHSQGTLISTQIAAPTPQKSQYRLPKGITKAKLSGAQEVTFSTLWYLHQSCCVSTLLTPLYKISGAFSFIHTVLSWETQAGEAPGFSLSVQQRGATTAARRSQRCLGAQHSLYCPCDLEAVTCLRSHFLTCTMEIIYLLPCCKVQLAQHM